MTANKIAEKIKAKLKTTGGEYHALRQQAEIKLNFWIQQARKQKIDYYTTYLIILEKLQNENN